MHTKRPLNIEFIACFQKKFKFPFTAIKKLYLKAIYNYVYRPFGFEDPFGQR